MTSVVIFYWFCFSGNGGSMFLLTDGGVLLNECACGYGTRHWWKLIPDATGSYVNGQWHRMSDSKNSRKYFASAVLADGRLLVCGGEYSDSGGSNANDDTSASEIYDPVADTWSSVTPPATVTNIGDSPCCMLADGEFLLGSYNGFATFLRDPATGNWTATGSKGDSGSEETWVLYTDGSVLAPQCSNAPNAEKYVPAKYPATGQWLRDGTLALNLVEPASIETGPGLTLPDGRAFFVGATGNTAIYEPSGTARYIAGPPIPQIGSTNRGSKDGPAALLPSGTVLFPVAPVDNVQDDYLPPSFFFEFDGTSLNRTADPPHADCPTYVGRLMLLPTGQVLWTREDDNRFYAYTENGGPQQSFRPVITQAPLTAALGSTHSVLGTQFNGLSQAVSYGDDYTAATNYPLVFVENYQTKAVRYCRTANHTKPAGAGTVPSMGIATGATIITTQVTFPTDLDLGPSKLVVVANGIQSAPWQLLIKREG